MSLGIVQVCNLVFPLITLPLIARIIGPDKFGVINYASPSSGILRWSSIMVFEMTATRIIAQCNKDQERSIKFSAMFVYQDPLLLVSIVGFCILLFALPTLRNEKSVAIYSFLICLGWVLAPNWLYQGMQDLNKIALFKPGQQIIFTIIILLTIKRREDYILQPLAFSIAQIAVSIYSFVYAFTCTG